ncbi:flavin-containing monooxygenase [Zobellella iuensis]|uniref:NAD(P)/FAD-dependent oxidoreductase n=1 Tax=Zobellella iuensis TaxID=2803811 RepID=A0ABS1QN77_9GAMM|nr:NAD(P)/FAD-dependent oxidoreductase [Zobellella iuensis]MBL1376313.1 NAD(P)/FAD-dependent oxidoreductase [Zobellella iuensis]
MTLDDLEQRLRQDLEWLDWPTTNWVPPREHQGQAVLDVAIIGGGMAGLAASAALRQLGIGNVRVFEQAPPGQAGPWTTFARMETLRSPKHLVGPALGLPSLTFRAWYQARFGEAAWRQLDKIPRLVWGDYLEWFRRVLALPVQHESRLLTVQPEAGELLTLVVQQNGERRRYFARHLVLATGMLGAGAVQIPDIAWELPRTHWQHSTEAIDFSALKGRRVGVVGGGDSAMDNAAMALEAGAARVDIFIRESEFARINYWKAMAHEGSYYGFQALGPEQKGQLLEFIRQRRVPPPRHSLLRIRRQPGGHFHFGSPVTGLRPDDDGIRLTTPGGTFSLDFLIFATGFRLDLQDRPELSALLPYVRWLTGVEQHSPQGYPDLNDDFSFRERSPGACPALERVHCFNTAATFSMGKISSDIPGIGSGARQLAQGITRSLYRRDFERHQALLRAFADAELLGDELA